MVIKERSSMVFKVLKNSRTDLSMRNIFFRVSKICCFITILISKEKGQFASSLKIDILKINSKLIVW